MQEWERPQQALANGGAPVDSPSTNAAIDTPRSFTTASRSAYHQRHQVGPCVCTILSVVWRA
jgi:hypothetical protein